MKCVYDCVAFVLSDIESVCVYHTGFHFHNTHIYVPYSGKFSLVQIFAEKCPDSSEEIVRFLFSWNAGRTDHTPTG